MRKAATALVAALLVVTVLPNATGVVAADLLSAGTGVTPPNTPTAAPSGQLRAYWVDAFGDGIYTPGQIDDVIAATKAAHLNAIVAQVVRRGDCLCNRALAPRTDQFGIDPAPFDPLQTLIDKAHASGIEVHAWIIATAIWQGSTPPTQPDHPFNLHGPSATGAANWLTKRSDGLLQMSRDWILDPGNPDAQQWIVDNALSIVRNYNVDGINLDRIRYPDGNLGTNLPSWGYNAAAVARFNAMSGRTGTPANNDPVWTQWRRDQITAIVRKIYVESNAIRPSVRVSADTITYGYGPQHSGGGFTGTRAYAEVLQDWDGWMREGILDTNILMNYKRDADANQNLMYREWSDYAKDNQYGRQSVIGTGTYLNDIASSLAQAHVAIAPSAAGNLGAGWAGYSYRTPDTLTDAGTRTGAQSRAILANFLTTPSSTDASPAFAGATPPVASLPWKASPTTGHVKGTTTANTRIELRDAAGTALRVQTSDDGGWFAFVDVAPGTYTIAAGGSVIGTSTVSAGQIAGIAAPVASAPCTSTVGPGIPAPLSPKGGAAGYHASWYGQSGYPTLCPGERATAVVAYYNSGSNGWLKGRMGEVAYLGTWGPQPGQDKASLLGGDGQLGTPNTGWARYNRISEQPAEYVGPGQVAWFQFTIQAPTTPGTYRLYLRPLIEGAQWMEDFGVFWLVTVR